MRGIQWDGALIFSLCLFTQAVGEMVELILKFSAMMLMCVSIMCNFSLHCILFVIHLIRG